MGHVFVQDHWRVFISLSLDDDMNKFIKWIIHTLFQSLAMHFGWEKYVVLAILFFTVAFFLSFFLLSASRRYIVFSRSLALLNRIFLTHLHTH